MFSGPHHGHYISIIKTTGTWFVFDDDNVYSIQENDIPKYFGDSTSGSAYVLYYQAVDIDLVSLGLRPLEPPPEVITNLIPSSLQQSPALQNQPLVLPVPVLPPGLNSYSVSSLESDADYNHLPPPIIPSPIPLHHSEPEEAVTVPISASIPQSRDLPATNSASPITSGFGTKLINSIRRAPSMSATRGSLGAAPGQNEGGERRSTTEKTPRPSLSTPSFALSGEILQEQPPPMPPLPPGVVNHSNSPLNATPISNTQVTDPKKEREKEKDKTKLTSNWFNKKRKTLRIGEKFRPESEEPFPSPAIKGDKHASPVPVSPSPNGAVVPRDLNGGPHDSGSEKSKRDHGPNGHLRKPPPEPVSPFPGSPYLNNAPSATIPPSHPQSRSSTLSSGSNPGAQPDFFPSRKPSLVLSSVGRHRSPIDRKKSVDSIPLSSSSTSRPMTAPSSPSHRTTDYSRTLPPLPPNPKTNSHRTNLSMSNGQAFFAEPQNTAKGKERSGGLDGSSASDKPTNQPSLLVSQPPASIAASAGQNNSVGSINSATSNIRKATRKLSFSFGRRDKEKDRERDRLLPSTFGGS